VSAYEDDILSSLRRSFGIPSLQRTVGTCFTVSTARLLITVIYWKLSCESEIGDPNFFLFSVESLQVILCRSGLISFPVFNQ
jgi:hypothetical protein